MHTEYYGYWRKNALKEVFKKEKKKHLQINSSIQQQLFLYASWSSKVFSVHIINNLYTISLKDTLKEVHEINSI